MSLNINELIPAVGEYKDSIDKWFTENAIVELPEFSELHDKNVWGVCYRNDQIYYEAVADFKSKFYAVKSAALHLLTEKYDVIAERENKSKTIKLIELLDNTIRELDNQIEKAKRRLKFYETITYVIGNVTYGSF